MPEPKGNSMSETLKWALITALLAGTNAGNYIGLAKPEMKVASEMQGAAEILGGELKACYAQLNECWATCQGNRTNAP